MYSIDILKYTSEYVLYWLMKKPLRYICPIGDAHPVVVFPGLSASDESTRSLRFFLLGLGYRMYSWNQGFNFGPKKGMDHMLERLEERLEEIHDETRKKVTLIGWSLGGLYARELAKTKPDLVRQVITLGTPFHPNSVSEHASFLYEFFSKDRSHKDPEVWKDLTRKPDVPFTSLYSKSDLVVKWRSSLEVETETSENIEIPYCSHLGLINNPYVMYIIADRLAQPDGLWKHYKKN